MIRRPRSLMFAGALALPAFLMGQCHGRPAVVTIHEFETARVDVHPPQRLDVVMSMINDSPIELRSAADRCNNMGGEPIWHPTVKVMVCEGVDF